MQSPLDSLQSICLCFSFVLFWAQTCLVSWLALFLSALDEYVKVIIIFCTSRAERQTSRSTLWARADPLTCQPSGNWNWSCWQRTVELSHSGAVAERLMAFALGLIATLKWFTLLCFGFVASPRTAIFLCQLISIALLEQMPTHSCTHIHLQTPAHTHTYS